MRLPSSIVLCGLALGSAARAQLQSTDTASATSGSRTSNGSFSPLSLGSACDTLEKESPSGEDWWKLENCKKVLGDSGSAGFGKCINIKALSQGGGPVGGGGYEGLSAALEKESKKYAEEGLAKMKEACQIATSLKSVSTNDATGLKDSMWQAAGLADRARQLWVLQFKNLDASVPFMKKFPNPLAPQGKTNDISVVCKKDQSCVAQCTSVGDKLKTVSQECADNLEKMRTWFEKRSKEAEALVAALGSGSTHGNYQIAAPSEQPTSIADSFAGVDLNSTNPSTETARMTADDTTSASAFQVGMPTSSGGSDSSYAVAPQGSSESLAAESYDAAAATPQAQRALAAASNSASRVGVSFDIPKGLLGEPSAEGKGATPLAGDFGSNYFSVQTPYDASITPAANLAAHRAKPNAREEYVLLDGLRQARAKLVTRYGRTELVYQELSLWERGAVRTVGAASGRGILMAEYESMRRELARKQGLRAPASAER